MRHTTAPKPLTTATPNLGEPTPARATRGAVVNVSAWFWAAGTMLVILSAWLVLDHGSADNGVGGNAGQVAQWLPQGWGASGLHTWRLLVLLVNMPVLLAAAALPWLPESPYWLVSQGRRASARLVPAY